MTPPMDALKRLVIAAEAVADPTDALSAAMDDARATLSVAWIVARRDEMERYADMDEKYRFWNRSERLKFARDLGHFSISQSIILEYRRLGSCALTGGLLGVTAAAIGIFLKKVGEPRRPRGGYNPCPTITPIQLSAATGALAEEKPHYLDSWCKSYIRRAGLPCSGSHLARRIRDTRTI